LSSGLELLVFGKTELLQVKKTFRFEGSIPKGHEQLQFQRSVLLRTGMTTR
jgi:hypothetical protein